MIGIIGGNGVAATNKLLEIIEKIYLKNGAYRDSHHPEMIIWQATQSPSRSMFLEGRGDSFVPSYVDIGKKLKSCGVDLLCMCCNTAHSEIDSLEKEIGLPFINVVKSTISKAVSLNYKRIGIIASDGTVKHKIYDRYLCDTGGEIELIYPSKTFQSMVTNGICNVKCINRFDNINSAERPLTIFNNIINHLEEQKCDLIILACTDISVDFDESNRGKVPIIDSLKVLAEKIVLTYGVNYER